MSSKRLIIVCPAQRDITNITLVVREANQKLPINNPAEEKKCTAVVLKGVVKGKSPHFCYLHEEDNYEVLLNAVLAFGDDEPVIVAFEGSVDEVELLVNFLTKELGDTYEVEASHVNAGSGSAVFILTKDLNPEVEFFETDKALN